MLLDSLKETVNQAFSCLLMNGFLLVIIIPGGQNSMILENSIKPNFIVLHLASDISSDTERDEECTEVVTRLFLSSHGIGLLIILQYNLLFPDWG